MQTHDLRWIKPIENIERISISLPGSKSVTNRALLLAALAHGESKLSGILHSDDTIVLMQALKDLGFLIKYDQTRGECLVQGSDGKIPKKTASLWCGSAGTVSRFLLAIVAAGQGEFRFDASKQMQSRPIGPIVSALQEQGAIIQLSPEGSLPLTLRSKGIAGGNIKLSSGHESSQYLSAMLLAAPLARKPVEIETSVSVSRPYIQMTLSMMESFGIAFDHNGYERILIDAPSLYKGCGYEIEADASTASYFFGAAAITGGTVHTQRILRSKCLQGDIRFLDILEKMGCSIIEKPDGVSITGPRKLNGITADLGDISDTSMTLACVAAYADSPTTILNVGHIRLKESDRIATVAANLKRMGIRTKVTADSLTIYPGTPQGAIIDSFDDHRIAMSFSMMGLVTPGVGIKGYECVSKTCPEFYALLDKLYP
jgi:3-phosphoshikimate 1-carboxyvinyltransferase